jgi:hypothetical protein
MTPDGPDHPAIVVVRLGSQVPAMLMNPAAAPPCFRCGGQAKEHDLYEFRDETGTLLRGGRWEG